VCIFWFKGPSPEVKVLETIQDYDTLVSLIAKVDHLMHGRFVINDDAAVTTAPSPTSPMMDLSEEDQKKWRMVSCLSGARSHPCTSMILACSNSFNSLPAPPSQNDVEAMNTGFKYIPSNIHLI